MDNKSVNVLSTADTRKMKDTNKRGRQTGETVKKPDTIPDNNVNMWPVDKSDMPIMENEFVR